MNGIHAISSWMRSWVARCLLLAAALAALLLILLWTNQETRRRIFFSDRYTLEFAAIDCPTPVERPHDIFLAEVQYLSDLPDRLHLLEDGLAERLAAAFARHPWVDKVDRVEITPRKQVLVELTFRTPELLVLCPTPKANTFVVDGKGVRLPGDASSAGLPVLRGMRHSPAGPAGTAWGDPTVEAAAHTAGFFRPHRAVLQVREVEMVADGLLLTLACADSPQSTFQVLWGNPPGGEKEEEAAADVKMGRLLQHCTKPGARSGSRQMLKSANFLRR